MDIQIQSASVQVQDYRITMSFVYTSAWQDVFSFSRKNSVHRNGADNVRRKAAWIKPSQARKVRRMKKNEHCYWKALLIPQCAHAVTGRGKLSAVAD
jgi:hypothetical protein